MAGSKDDDRLSHSINVLLGKDVLQCTTVHLCLDDYFPNIFCVKL